MGRVFLILITLVSKFAHADMAFVDGKVYDLKLAELRKCGSVGSSELLADKTVLVFAKKNGIASAVALCSGGVAEYCSKDAQTKFGLELLFKTARRYPSKFQSAGCKEVRAECTSLCLSENIVSAEDCQIECNQYDAWNK